MSSDCQIQQACRCCLEKAAKEIEKQNQTFLEQRAIMKELQLQLQEETIRQVELAKRIEQKKQRLKERAIMEQGLKLAADRLEYGDQLATAASQTAAMTLKYTQTLKAVKEQLQKARDGFEQEDVDICAEVSIVLSGDDLGDEELEAIETPSVALNASDEEVELDWLRLDKTNSQVVFGSVVHHENLSRSQHHMKRNLTMHEIRMELSEANEISQVSDLKEQQNEPQVQLIERLVKEERFGGLSAMRLRAELVRNNVQCIPYSLRERIWQLLIGNPLFITNQIYELSIEKARSKLDRLTTKTIECDLSRTFPHLKLFQQNTDMTCDLRELLHALAIFCRCGYVQGLAYPASLTLLLMDKYKAFRCLANLLSTEFLHLMLTFDQHDYRLKNRIFEHLIKKHLPKVWKHLNNSGISPEVLLVEWFYSLYCRAFRLEVVMKVWDRLLIDGQPAYYSVALAILKLCERTVLQAEPTIAYSIIKTQSRLLTFEQLMECNRKFQLTTTTYHDTIHLLTGK